MKLEELQAALDSPTARAQAFMAGFQLRGEKEEWPSLTMAEIVNVIEVLRTQMEAARLVADIDAATERILDRMGMHEHTQQDWDKAYELAQAALTRGDPARDIAALMVAPDRLPQTQAELLTPGDTG